MFIRENNKQISQRFEDKIIFKSGLHKQIYRGHDIDKGDIISPLRLYFITVVLSGGAITFSAQIF